MKVLSSSIEKLCTHWGSSIPQVAIVRAVKSTFPFLNDIVPPVDPYYLAKTRGVKEIIHTEIEPDGIISLTPSGEYIIRLNSRQPNSRKRFTVAHEVGHTLFFELEDQNKSRFPLEESGIESLRTDWGEEYICNIAAIEILMPFNQFASKMQKSPPTAATVLQLAGEFKTSLQATARRIVQFSPYKLMICLWEYKPITNSYETVWHTKLNSKNEVGQEKLIVTRDQPIFKAFDTEANFRGREWVSLAGPIDDYLVDGIVLKGQSKRLITVFILEPRAERLMGSPICREVSSQEQLKLF